MATRSQNQQWELGPEELPHLLNVLRLRAGDDIELTNGQGFVARAKISHTTKSSCSFDVVSEDFFSQPATKIEVYVGALKPNTLESMISPLVEIGVSRIAFFGQKGGEKFRISEKVRERCEKIVTSAAKQCKCPYLPVVDFWSKLDDVLTSTDFAKATALNLTMHPQGDKTLKDLLIGESPDTVRFFIGGEKGWDDSELEILAMHEHARCALGSNVLRAWTAAITCASAATQFCVNP